MTVDYDIGEDCTRDVTDFLCSSSFDGSAWSGTLSNWNRYNSGPDNAPIDYQCINAFGDIEVIYSVENIPETTADLITRTESAIPAYPDTWTGTCSSYRNLSGDETSYSARQHKWRIAHPPSGTCYLKVWLQQVETPENGSPTITALDPYEWTGTGNPCLSDDTLAVDHEDNKVTGDETEIGIPTEDGTITVEIVKYSCVPGYEPDISDPANPQPNGYPDPAWTA